MPIINYNSVTSNGTEQFSWSRWIGTSVWLFITWHLLWQISIANAKHRDKLYIAIVICYGVLTYVAFNDLEVKFLFFQLLRTYFVMLLLFLVQYSLKSSGNISNLRLEKEQLQKENYKTQLKALRSQIDPHFLFSSLNTLRSMIRQGNAGSEKFVISLSDFYRQTLKYNENTTLPLDEELEVLKSYLFLMKNRNEEAVFIAIDVDEELESFHIPTLALQQVVENCFKHNSMTSKMPLHIEVKSEPDFYISISNNIQLRIDDGKNTGYELSILKKRYELLNIENGVLIESDSDQFIVKLKLIER